MGLLTLLDNPYPGGYTPAYGCAYSLLGEPPVGGVPMVVSGAGNQTAVYTTTSGGPVDAYAVPTGGSKFDFTSGTRVIEWQSILMPAGAGGGTTAIAYMLNLGLTTAITPVGGVVVRLSVLKNGTRYIGVLTDPTGSGTYTVQYENTAASSFPSTVAIVADCTGGTVSVLLDGVAVTLTSAAFTAGQYTAWVGAGQNSLLAAGDVGKTVGATLVTSAASMTGGYWNGVTDPCGNATGNILWYDFTTQPPVPSGFTYTRNSAERVWSPSLNQYAGVAANVYAPDYNPLTGLCRGFRSETAATNLLLWSADFSNAAWVGDNASKGAAGTLMEGGTAQSVTQTSAGGFLYQTVGTFTGAAHTVQVLVEKGANAAVTRLTMRNTTDGADVGSVSLTWATGAAVAFGSGTAFAFKRREIGPNGGEVYLIALSGFVGTSGKTRQVRIFPDTTASNAVVYVHHAQLVSGTRVSSPIVTGAASAARQADVMKMLTLPAWFDQAKYTLFAEVELEQFPIDVTTCAVSVNDGTTANRSAIYWLSSGAAQLRVVVGSVIQAGIDVGTLRTGVEKTAASVTANSFLFARNGTGGTPDTSGTMPVVTQINIGSDAGASQCGGWIRKIGIAPRTMTTAELQALTA